MVGSQLYEHLLTPGFRRSIANFATLKAKLNIFLKKKESKKRPLFKRLKFALLNIWSFWRTGPTATPLGGAGALPAPFRAPQGKIFLKNGIFCNFPVARCARWPPLHRPAFGQGAVLFFVRVHRV